MTLEVISARYTSKEKKQFLALINTDKYKNLPYYVSLVQDDSAPIYKVLREKYDSGELIPDDFIQDPSVLANEIRAKRDNLLSTTDKYMATDYPISKDKKKKIKEYRQALRDITNQDGFPENVVFPESPI